MDISAVEVHLDEGGKLNHSNAVDLLKEVQRLNLASKKIDAHAVVEAVIGQIDPVGETHMDNDRYENLKAMTELAEFLMDDIKDVAFYNKDRQEFSMKRAGTFAQDFLNAMKMK